MERPSAARVPAIFNVPPARPPVSVRAFAAVAEPVSSTAVVGATQSLFARECTTPLIAPPESDSSPVNTGSRAALASAEAICQLPETATALATGTGSTLTEQPSKLKQADSERTT